MYHCITVEMSSHTWGSRVFHEQVTVGSILVVTSRVSVQWNHECAFCRMKVTYRLRAVHATLPITEFFLHYKYMEGQKFQK